MSSTSPRFNIWDSKTRIKRTRKQKQVKDIRAAVDEGYRHFWARRKANPFGGGM